MEFSEVVIKWYYVNKRNLPWRETTNPYYIWLSEVILQQTRVAQGEPYYNKFIDKFPTVIDLASASEDQVLYLWQGLGYYSRARNLHQTARFITHNLNGSFPTSYNNLIQLKGIGDYTASAIASFAANENVAVLDGNVFRVLSRYFDIDFDISDQKNKKYFKDILSNLLPKGFSADFNQAIMEFGALQCVPKNPNCSLCPFYNSCLALKNKTVNTRPVKLKKAKVKNRYFNYIILSDIDNKIYIEKRESNDIWKNLYQLKLYETTFESNDNEVVELIQKEFQIIDNSFKSLSHLNIIHKLTHQKLMINFFEARVQKSNACFVPSTSIKDYAFPIVLVNFLEKIV